MSSTSQPTPLFAVPIDAKYNIVNFANNRLLVVVLINLEKELNILVSNKR
jgi:hypothetical protein